MAIQRPILLLIFAVRDVGRCISIDSLKTCTITSHEMLVVFGLLFYISRLIFGKVDNTLKRFFLLDGERTPRSLLAGLACDIFAPCFPRQLAYKFSELSTVFHQDSGVGEQKRVIEEAFIRCPQDANSVQSLSKALALKRGNVPPDLPQNGNGNRLVHAKMLCLLFDTLAGVIFFIFLWKVLPPNTMLSYFIQWRDATHSFLNRLLEWLMGAPAGLKLNQEMTVFFGNFFIYHVYIWIGYLSILQPYYMLIIKTIMYSNFLGLSVMLSLANDTLRFLTFHTYCFYVYAAKVYKLQVQALISLSRLMRGQKWNPLRARVDSIPYDASQLAFGAVIFTVLLFLLPTTGIYYLVFTLLRLPVIILQSAAYCSVRILTTIPVHDILGRIFLSIGGRDELSMNVLYGSHKMESQINKSNGKSRHGSLIHLSQNVSLDITFNYKPFQELLLQKTDFGCKHTLPLNTLVKYLLLGEIVDIISGVPKDL